MKLKQLVKRFTPLRLFMLLSLLATCTKALYAQEAAYRYEIGAGLGMSGYLGEANTSSLFKHPGFAGTATFRYLINTRWALRGSIGMASLSGNSADMKNVYPARENIHFQVNTIRFQCPCRIQLLQLRHWRNLPETTPVDPISGTWSRFLGSIMRRQHSRCRHYTDVRRRALQGIETGKPRNRIRHEQSFRRQS